MLRHKAFTHDLNLQTHNRVSVVAIYGLLLALTIGISYPQGLVIGLGLAVLLIWLNIDLYRFFYQKRGFFFALRVVPLHWLYYFYNAISFGCGLLLYWHKQFRAEIIPPPEPLADGVETDAHS